MKKEKQCKIVKCNLVWNGKDKTKKLLYIYSSFFLIFHFLFGERVKKMNKRKSFLIITGSIFILVSAGMLLPGFFVYAQSKLVQIEFFNGKKLKVEIARTEEEIAFGLMYRKELEENSGMLFIFPESTKSGFWMKNTHIPLSIAFIDEKGVIVDKKDMEPCKRKKCPHYYSKYPYQLALEVNKGWFDKNDIQIGDKIKLIK